MTPIPRGRPIPSLALRVTAAVLCTAAVIAGASTVRADTRTDVTADVTAGATASAGANAATATTRPASTPVDADEASGRFAFTTANGILPTWTFENIRVTGVSPGSAITDAKGTRTRVTIPIIATKGSANFAAGGFRLTNIETGDFVNCATPVIDTKARVVDCVVKGTNRQILAITKFGTRSTVLGPSFTTTTWRGLELRVADTAMADYLNETLETNAFSPSVRVATAELSVSRPR